MKYEDSWVVGAMVYVGDNEGLNQGSGGRDREGQVYLDEKCFSRSSQQKSVID